ncbi:WxcM-like domain-containing protein, partial [Campylobacter jejuni]|nr:WxcM-like domain-containing protein [Campylobacter jejuni]EAL9891273.1 WxcM-like domain-containing protein [Campylobacter jejuni]ECT4291287.1 WxcM-like domain-containing protein [Campylobacter jejuni]EDJ6378799.1 WxcM-like domain-containing protein [Campylobacter jejuni]
YFCELKNNIGRRGGYAIKIMP